MPDLLRLFLRAFCQLGRLARGRAGSGEHMGGSISERVEGAPDGAE